MKQKYKRSEYIEYLQSNEWKAKRIAKAKEQEFTCEKCHKKVPVGYHIHHRTYKRLKNELLSDLMFLCEDCHKTFHKTRKTDKIIKGTPFVCPYCKSGLFIVFVRKVLFIKKHILYCNKCKEKIGKIILKK